MTPPNKARAFHPCQLMALIEAGSEKYIVESSVENIVMYRCVIWIVIFFWSTATVVADEGIPSLENLNIDQLTAGEHHLYLKQEGFRGARPENIPIMVMKGETPGKKLMLTAAIHGDELNGIRVLHALFSRLEASSLTGVVIAVPGVNQAGIEVGSRYYVRAPGAKFSDLNRAFSGGGGTAEATRQAAAFLWTHLFENNADLVVDLHTQAVGAAYPLFVFADFKDPVAKQMAYAVMPDIIKVDNGHKGTLETAYMELGVPAITLELGGPNRIDAALVTRAVDGLLNVMKQQGMVSGEVEKSVPYVGLSYSDISASSDGFFRITSPLLTPVKAGEKVAVRYNSFGQELEVYHAPHAGVILTTATVPRRKKGDMLVRIIQ